MDPTYIAKALCRPIPEEYYKQREGRGGTYDYVGWSTACWRVINATDNNFSFEILESQILYPDPTPVTKYNKSTGRKEPVVDKDGNPVLQKYAPIVIIHGRLTIPELGCRDGYGSHVLEGNGDQWGDAFKAARSDAFRNCANLFGVGLELYSEPLQEEDEEVSEEDVEGNYTGDDFDSTDIEKLRALMDVMGIQGDDDLVPYIQEFSNGQMTGLDDITPQNIQAFIQYLEEICADMDYISDEDLGTIQELGEAMGIKTDEDWVQYVEKFDDKLKSIDDINGLNVKEFINYLQQVLDEQLAGVGTA